MRVVLLLFITFSLLFSCKPNVATEQGAAEEIPKDILALENQVMVIHDEVMPRMKDINNLSSQLRAIRATLKESESGKLESPAGLDEMQSALKLAEQGMWDWMKSFSDTKPTLQKDQLKPFYEKELEKINKVKQDMLDAIEKATAWLAAYPK